MDNSPNKSFVQSIQRLVRFRMPKTQKPPIQINVTPRDERRPTVFISYSHDSEAHKEQVLSLSDRLRADGIETRLDQYVTGSPVETWPRWMLNQLDEAKFVLVICTETYYRRFRGKEEPGKGKGVDWEGALITQELYDARFSTDKFVPVLFSSDQERFIPEPLRGRTFYQPTISQAAYDALYDFLLGQAGVEPGEVGELKLKSRRKATPLSFYNEPNQAAQRELELAYLEWLKREELKHTERYTPMSGDSQRRRRVEMQTVFELVPVAFGKGFLPTDKTEPFDDAVKVIHRIRRAVLLGEPGGGKTTTIWKLAADLVNTATIDPQAPIPLLVRLGGWIEADQSLPEFIAAQLGDLGDYLDSLLAQKRSALLLDGLNELPPEQRDDKYPQVQSFIEQHKDLLAVVSCRKLDYENRIDLGFNQINITPLDPQRILDFVIRYLDQTSGENLFWRLAGGSDVRELWPVWQKAGASFDQFWNAPDIPKENPNVYGQTTGDQDRIWLEKVRGKHSLMELARNPYMLSMLAYVYTALGETLPDNRGELFHSFVQTLLKREKIPDAEQQTLTDGLAKLAFAMQTNQASGQTSDNPPDETASAALTVLSKDQARACLNEHQLYLAGSASILSLGQQVRFTHQLLQEYFAARCMDIKIQSDKEDGLKARDIWLSERWWNRTNWEEAAILLAGLYSDDCTKIVEWVALGNPEVAAQCVVRSGAALAEATKEGLRAEWIYRLTDLKDDPNPLSRAAVGRALGLTGWDNRKGVGIVEQNGVMLPDIDWVRIPEGEFQYGDEKAEYAAKPQKLTLPTFWLSRYPITYGQFQTFVDDPEGLKDPRWFEGLAASEEEHQAGDQAFKFDNHPRERVSWYQAMAFCRWLSWRLGGLYDLKKVADWEVRLPTEFEWEKAARGTDGRLYPYKGEYDPKKGNTEQIIGQTSAVGIFPNGASPYGVEEMSGNVWEWCLSNYSKPKFDAAKENLRTDDNRVLRGGSWGYDRGFARAVYRNNNHPANHNNHIGFRVLCCRPPSS